MAISTPHSISTKEIIEEFAGWSQEFKAHNKSVTDGAYVIGIAGCTNSGKSTLSRTLSAALTKENMRASVICQDTFFYRKENVDRIASRADPMVLHYYFDTVKAVDINKFLLCLQKAIDENDFVVVEGNMILEIGSLCRLLHRAVFVTLSRDLCERRRKERKYDPPDLPGYFEELVWPAYKSHLFNAFALAHHSPMITFVDGNIHNFFDECEVKKLFSKLSKNLLLLQAEELRLSQAINFVSSPKDGAVSVFIGITRDNFRDKQVVRLEFEAYNEMVYKEMDKLSEKVRLLHPAVDKIALFHRVGKVSVSEASVIIAISSPHRQDAIRATETAIDYLKRKLPIWKREIYSDGTSSWKENSEWELH